jgi:hypothetical protein
MVLDITALSKHKQKGKRTMTTAIEITIKALQVLLIALGAGLAILGLCGILAFCI